MSLSYLEWTVLSNIKKMVTDMSLTSEDKDRIQEDVSNALQNIASNMTGLVDAIANLQDQVDRSSKRIEEQIYKLTQATWAGRE